MVKTSVAPVATYPKVSARWVRDSYKDHDGNGDPLSKRWPVRSLTEVERATVRVRIDWSVTPPEETQLDVAGNAALRLRAHEVRGRLFGRSGSALAAELWGVFYGNGPTPKYAWRGYEILCHMDADAERHGVSVWIDAEPLPFNPARHRVMRLSERVKELGA
ncbi:hypothetical protein ACFFIO_07125 [Citricoccus parietis]|uniref:RES domain-containing protein n=1 Tax=Citricoccus parietis TaxID=592307 RepID=A0ABV6F569_9MICC